MGIRSNSTLSLLLLPALVGAKSHERFGMPVVGPVQHHHLAVTCDLFRYLESQVVGLGTACVQV